MLDQFKAYLRDNGLAVAGDRILLAVSGGIDSVVMADLFKFTDLKCAIAHCNFQLRGEDSEADEALVRSIAASRGIPVYVERFDVDAMVKEEGISVQMAARKLRYNWFGELLDHHSYDSLAMAHNKNDSVETFFLNLTRGTGIRGLTGIQTRNQRIIRPLLFATREMITQYASAHHLAYREDASNLETKYRRNKIRHDILPVFNQINPGFIETMGQNMKRLEESLSLYSEHVRITRNRLFKNEKERIFIDIKEIKALSPLETWLFELFSPFGFTRSQCEGIKKIMESDPGKRSISASHQLFKDRHRLILVESAGKAFDRYYLDSPDNLSSLPFPMDVELIERSSLGRIPGDEHIACLDFDKIDFPLTIRHWLHGDYFFPLGMDQIKKLSDFFVDQKIPVPEKQRTWILASGRKIVWIMGYRIDNRFRITEQTKNVLVLRLHPDIAP